jgi:hypothetical protein
MIAMSSLYQPILQLRASFAVVQSPRHFSA